MIHGANYGAGISFPKGSIWSAPSACRQVGWAQERALGAWLTHGGTRLPAAGPLGKLPHTSVLCLLNHKCKGGWD